MVTVSNNHQKYNQLSIQYTNLELKRTGAPFASMLRRHQSDGSDPNDSVLKVVFVILTSSSNVKQFGYSSIFLQPMDLNFDEETLMKLASFWRTSLSDSESQRIYFDHFEIHPIKDIVAKLQAFSQLRQHALCILSGTGTVSSVILRQPTSTTINAAFEGRFQILCLSGSYLVVEDGGPQSRTGGISVSLSSPDGHVIGGGVARLIAASPVQLGNVRVRQN